MSEQLVIRLGANVDDAVYWCIWSSSDKALVASGCLPSGKQLNTLKERAGHRPVAALVPSTDIKLSTVELPHKANAKVLAALPFMLEDDVVGDVDDHFFAFGAAVDNQQTIAAVNRSKMHEWLVCLSEAEITCERLIPDVLALPLHENAISGLGLENEWLFRLGAWNSIAGELSWVLPTLTQFVEKQQDTKTLHLYSPLPDESDTANLAIQSEPEELPMEVMASQLSGVSFNLLQGEFKIRKKLSESAKQWRWVAVLAALALFTNVANKGIEAYLLSTQSEQLSAQIAAAYKQAFPKGGAPKEGIMKRQIASKLSKSGSGSDTMSFLVMLTQMAPAFTEHEVRPQTMKFDAKRNELRLQAIGKGFRNLEQFKTSVQQLGYEVTQGAINNKEDYVVGSLSIKR